jgi:hypothetical protein
MRGSTLANGGRDQHNLTAAGMSPAMGGHMKIRSRSVAVVHATLGILGAAAVAAGPASAVDYQPPQVKWVADTVYAPAGTKTAIVRARYKCFGGAPTHLYIGVKQGPQVNATTHTSSDYARAFYSTNWNADGPGLSLDCDGEAHQQSFLLKPQPGFDQKQQLRDGPAFVQFCIFDSTNSGADGDLTGFAFDYSMRTVNRTG